MFEKCLSEENITRVLQLKSDLFLFKLFKRDKILNSALVDNRVDFFWQFLEIEHAQTRAAFIVF